MSPACSSRPASPRSPCATCSSTDSSPGASSRMRLPASLAPGTRRRRLLLALAVYLVATGIYFACAPPDRITRHTAANHYALLAFGTVYFFTAVQGEVWFAAHVVAVPLIAGYLMCAPGAERPVLAGLLLVLAFATRGMPVALGGVLFVLEAARVSLRAPLVP